MRIRCRIRCRLDWNWFELGLFLVVVVVDSFTIYVEFGLLKFSFMQLTYDVETEVA